jgi:phosphatidylglycerophosphatase A
LRLSEYYSSAREQLAAKIYIIYRQRRRRWVFTYFPGTKGTLLAIPISIGFNGIAAHAPLSFGLLLAILTVGAISLSTTADELLKQKDPQMIVIDEVIGFYDRQLSRAGSMGVVNPRFLAFPLLRYRESFPRYAFGKAARRHGHTAR